MGYFCGIDIGGTFTDCVVADDQGNLVVAKVSSTPPEFAEGFLAGLAEAARQLGISFEQLLAETELILHGTTVGTNALLQMNGARTGLITTAGHGDALTMMRSAGRSAGLPIDRLLHVSRHRKPEPIVPPRRIKEVTQRLDWAGREIVPLREEDVRRAIDELRDEGVEAIAISYLWGFLDPAHERRTREMVEELAPGVFVCCAHEILAKPGEYERTAGTAINAFIGPSTSSYIERLDRALREAGSSSPLLIMQAAGGVVPAAEAASKPLFTISSGPVGGVSATVDLAARLGDRNVVACDMGGTSFDVGLVAEGEPIFSDQTVSNQYTFFMPRLDIESIGSGGGSIVWLDQRSRTLRVGPRSAGARPGPVSYGRGGEEPTITDCNVLLGRFDTESFLGGKVALDLEATERALGGIAGRLGMAPVELADGALRIVESQMADLMRQMTIERGLDPRDFAIYAFGGACGAHAAGFAREFEAQEVVVPLGDLASTWSALGVMSSDVIHVFERAELMTAPFDHERLNELIADLETEAVGQLRQEGFDDADIELARFAKMKFSLQIHQLDVPLPTGRLTAADAGRQVERFLARYEETFGEGAAFVEAGAQIGLVRLIARGRVASPPVPDARPEPSIRSRSRRAYWRELGDFHETPVHAGRTLTAGTTIAGPALIDYPDTTVVVPPGDAATIDAIGNVRIAIGDRKVRR